jgi:hypothetical protein
MRRCYIELADNPQTNRHHQLKGKLKGFGEYEVDGVALGTSAALTIALLCSWSMQGPLRPIPTERPFGLCAKGRYS